MNFNNEIYQQYMYSYPHKKAYYSLNNVSFDYYVKKLETLLSAVYMHIPFCSCKCGYCNLFSIAGVSNQVLEQYTSAILTQIDQIDEKANLKTNMLVLGGGTPLSLWPAQLEKLIKKCENIFGIQEVQTETSPKETNRECLTMLEQHNTRRISIGVQSFIDSELASIHRFHKKQDCFRSILMIKDRMTSDLNIDLIYGIPNQTQKSFKYSLEAALSFEPEEIFIYPLYIRQNKNIQGKQPNMYQLYVFATEFLKQNGYYQQSMRRFSKKTKNIISCGNENSLALGVGGRSYIENVHFCSSYSDNAKISRKIIEQFIKKENKNEIVYGYILDEFEEKRRFIIKNLFVCAPFSLANYKKRFQNDVMDDFPILKQFIENKYIIQENNIFHITEKGIALSDYLAPKFISPIVADRMLKWNE